MKIYYYNTRNVQFMWSQWEKGVMPAHLLYGAPQLTQHGIEIVQHRSVDEPRRWRLMLVNAWRILTCRESYDVLYGTAFRGLELIILLRAIGLYRHPVVVWHHQPIVKAGNRLRELVAKLFYRGIDDMFFFSEKLISDSMASAKARPERMHLAHWGADLEFYDRVLADNLPKQYEFISTGKELRDHTTLVKAFNQTRYRLDVFTPKVHHAENPDPALETIPLNSNITVHYTNGQIIPYELACEVSQSTCVVCCCYETNYTTGLTSLVEALALGLPIVASRNPQVPFDIDKEGCGITVPYGDVEGWSRAVEYISTHPDEAAKMGQRSRELAELLYNNNRCAAEIAEVILSAKQSR
ncbi:MAG: glycosyltransferase family 4 protein [Bacteroidaceae bacterium]|nr:glycosyltransferase family 4 protein [Bacteroidaceae bacterium]